MAQLLTCSPAAAQWGWAPSLVGSRPAEVRWSCTDHSLRSLRTRWSICFWSHKSGRPQKGCGGKPKRESSTSVTGGRWKCPHLEKNNNWKAFLNSILCPSAGSRKASFLAAGGTVQGSCRCMGSLEGIPSPTCSTSLCLPPDVLIYLNRLVWWF